MTKDEFRIGRKFHTASGKWRCTDIGTRVIVAIKLDQEDPRNYNGPPYSIAELVFDEYDMEGCSLDPTEQAAARYGFAVRERHHLMEAVRRRPLNPRAYQAATAVGLMLFLMLTVLVTYKDIAKLIA